MLLGAAFASLYLLTPTANYYWDGITFALQIEKVLDNERNAFLLFHQNHLVYNAAGYVLLRIARTVFSDLRAFSLLQVGSALLAASAIGKVFQTAHRITSSRHIAMLSSVALGVSAVWWKFATDANAYMPSLLLVLTCIDYLLRADPRPFSAGLALGAAMLLHQLAALVFPAALCAILSNRMTSSRIRGAVTFSATAWTMAIGGYYICAVLLHGISDPISLVAWATSNPSGVRLSLSPFNGLLLAPRANLDAIVGHNFQLLLSGLSWGGKAIALASLALAVGLCVLVLYTAKLKCLLACARFFTTPLVVACQLTRTVILVWIMTYFLFLLFWEPWQTYYGIFYLPAFALLFGLLVSSYQHCVATGLPVQDRKHSMPAALLVLCLALFNLAFFIVPNMHSMSNPLVELAKGATSQWNSGTIIYFAARDEVDTAFEYFNKDTQWRRLPKDSIAELDEHIRQAHATGNTVWLNKGACEGVGKNWLRERASGRSIEAMLHPTNVRYVEVLPLK